MPLVPSLRVGDYSGNKNAGNCPRRQHTFQVHGLGNGGKFKTRGEGGEAQVSGPMWYFSRVCGVSPLADLG